MILEGRCWYVSNHYYSKNPQVKSNTNEIEFTLRGRKLIFTTDSGVFSKKEVDFGSRLLIESYVGHENAKVLDVGCGYGPIGISIAADFPNAEVHMVDINERAIGLSKSNIEKNGLKNICVYESDALKGVSDNGFSAILSNPPIRAGKKVVHEILETSFSKLDLGGELWIVIQKKQGAPSAEKKILDVYGNVEVVCKKGGYFILKAVKEAE